MSDQKQNRLIDLLLGALVGVVVGIYAQNTYRLLPPAGVTTYNVRFVTDGAGLTQGAVTEVVK